jgi:hypothetical protein
VGDFSEPGELDDNCGKTTCVGMMDRGFTVFRNTGLPWEPDLKTDIVFVISIPGLLALIFPAMK